MINREVKKSIIDTGLKMEELAEELNMSRQNLHRILSRKARRSEQTLRVAQRLGIDECLILPDSDNGNRFQQSCQN